MAKAPDNKAPDKASEPVQSTPEGEVMHRVWLNQPGRVPGVRKPLSPAFNPHRVSSAALGVLTDQGAVDRSEEIQAVQAAGTSDAKV